MSSKHPRLRIENQGKYTVFTFPRHEAIMHFSKTKTLFEEVGAAVSVFVGDATKPRINWKIRMAFTTDERVEVTLIDSKGRKEVSAWIDQKEFVKNRIMGCKEFVLSDPASYRVWE